MMVSEIKLYEILKLKFGEKEAETVVEGIRQEVKTEFENYRNIFATKEDIYLVKEDIAKLETKISDKHNDLLKWMIVIWITQLGAIVAILKFMIH